MIFIQNGSTFTRSVENKLNEFINVADFGANKSATDNTEAFRKAISAAVGKTLWIPSGTYHISGTLTIPPATTLRGEGRASTRLFHTGSGVFINTSHGIQPSYATECTITNLSILGSAGSTTGIDFKDCVDSIIQNVEVNSFNNGIEISGGWNILLQTVKCVFNRNEGFYLSDEANAITLISCVGLENTRSGICLDGSRAVNLINCTWEKNSKYIVDPGFKTAV